MPRWKLSGYDTFAGQPYPLPGSYRTQQAAERAARRQLGHLELSQPSEISGGQAGIQDQVFVHRPDGTSNRFQHPEPIRPGIFTRLAWRLGLLPG